MNDEWVSGTIRLKLHGEPVEMQMTVPAKPVKVRKMLPIFQAITNNFVEIGEAVTAAEGEQISCAKGCGACCRQVVPIAEMEAFYLAELIENLPEPRRSEIKRRFALSVQRLVEIDWFERLKKYREMSYEERVAISMEYFYLGIPCPFLENDACSIHPNRPIVCREYLVTSPAVNCQNPTPQTVKPIKMPFQVKNVMNRFNEQMLFVPLIGLLGFVEQFPESENLATGADWMRKFLTFLKQQEETKEPESGNPL